MKEITVTQEMIVDYERDGVICMRNVVDMSTVERLREAVAAIMSAPGAVVLQEDGSVKPVEPASAAAKIGSFKQAMNGFQRSEAYHDVIFSSCIPRIVAELTHSTKLRILYDQTLVKEPGSTTPTNWHQDLPFWPVSGNQICNVWVALDEVTQDSGAVNYGRGSHKDPIMYRPETPQVMLDMGLANADLPPAPNLFEDPNADLLSWELQPGDVLVFTAMTLHGSKGNSRSDRSRRGIAIRYIGDDVRWVEGMHVLNFAFPEQPKLKTGDPLEHPYFPIVWEKN